MTLSRWIRVVASSLVAVLGTTSRVAVSPLYAQGAVPRPLAQHVLYGGIGDPGESNLPWMSMIV